MVSISAPVLVLAAALSGLSSIAVAQTDPIKGADVMGDKNRSGPDGWVQAPVTRDQAPAAATKAAGETKTTVGATSASHQVMSPGEDPGTPVTPATGPGRENAAPR